MRKSKRRINNKGIVILFFMLLISVTMSGCSWKYCKNTSESINLYQGENKFGDKIVVDKDGKQNVFYRIDIYGNIVRIRDNDKVVLTRNVEKYKEKQPEEIICVIPVAQNNEQVIENVVIPEQSPATTPEIIINLSPEPKQLPCEEIVIETPVVIVPEPENYPPVTRSVVIEEIGNTLYKYVDNTINFLQEEVLANVSVTQNVQSTATLNAEPPVIEAVVVQTPQVEIIEDIPHIHTWNDGEVIVGPNCISEGLITYKCTNCDQVSDKIIEKTDHEYADGTCKVCGSTDSSYVKQEHTHEYTYLYEISAPSCTMPGKSMYICTCSETIEQEINALGHNYINGICDRCAEVSETYHVHSFTKSYSEIEPSCTQPGIDIYTCNCGQTKRVETQLNHHYINEVCTLCGHACTHNWEIIEYKEPDCYSKGINHRKCKDCNAVEIENYNTQHTYNAEGKCIICGYEDTDIYRAYGRYLSTSGMSEYDKMMDIVNYVAANCHGDCIQCSYAAIAAGSECGVYGYYRHVNQIICPALGKAHTSEMFMARDGFCEGCGMGNNHHWIRFELSDGNWYEFDIQGLGTYYAGPNTEVHQSFYSYWYQQ